MHAADLQLEAGRSSSRRRLAHAAATAIAALAASLLLLLLAAPIVRLTADGGAAGVRALATDAELRASLLLTVATASSATLLAALTGTPIAYLLARRRFPGRALLSALLDLPLLIPHPVAGLALLLVLGANGAAGRAALAMGVRVVGTPVGIVLAMLFVSAPIYVSAARESFARVDARLEGVARTLGDSSWGAVRRVTLPLAARGLLAAGVVTWARAVSEFGAIVVLAYHPRVASVLAYERFTSYGLAEALPVAAVLALLALVPLTLLRSLER